LRKQLGRWGRDGAMRSLDGRSGLSLGREPEAKDDPGHHAPGDALQGGDLVEHLALQPQLLDTLDLLLVTPHQVGAMCGKPIAGYAAVRQVEAPGLDLHALG